MAVVVIGSMRFPPEHMAAVRPHLEALCKATREIDGATLYDVAEDLFDPGLIRFSELWGSNELLLAHLKAPHIAPWREVALALGVSGREFTAFDSENPRAV